MEPPISFHTPLHKSPLHTLSCLWIREESSTIMLVLSMNSVTLSAYSHHSLWCLAFQDLSRLQEVWLSLPLHCYLFRHGLWCVLILQPPLWEPVAQTSSAVMMAGASHPPGSVMETTTVGTWVMKTRGTTVVSDPCFCFSPISSQLISSAIQFNTILFYPFLSSFVLPYLL